MGWKVCAILFAIFIGVFIYKVTKAGRDGDKYGLIEYICLLVTAGCGWAICFAEIIARFT